jgi:hypothetical protein
METTIHSHTEMAWPADKLARMNEAAAARKAAEGTDHFPIKNRAHMDQMIKERVMPGSPQAKALAPNVVIPGAPLGPNGRPPLITPTGAAPAPAANGPRPGQGPQHMQARAHMPQNRPTPTTSQAQVEAEMFDQFLQQGLQHQQPPMEQTRVADAVAQVTQQQGLQVPNEMPGFTNPTADAEYTSVALPSRFAFYGFKDLYVKPFAILHLGKLQRAHSEKSLLPIVEAMSSVIYTTDERYQGVPMAFELTLPDFFMVLYWLRLNSFTKSNYIHTTICQNEDHIRRVEDGQMLDQYLKQVQAGTMAVDQFNDIKNAALDPETLKISEVIRRTDMKVNELTQVPDPELYQLSDPRLYLRPPTMRDVIEMAEDPQMRNPATRHEFGLYSRLASHFQHTEVYMTLAQRVEIIKSGSGDDYQVLTEFEKVIDGYGVEEKIRVQCKCCGATRDTKLQIAAHSFFQ